MALAAERGEHQHQHRRDPHDQVQWKDLEQAAPADDRQSADGPQPERRADADGDRIVVLRGQVRGDDLGEVAELGDQDHGERGPGDLAVADVVAEVGGFLTLLLALLLAVAAQHEDRAQHEQGGDDPRERTLRDQGQQGAGGDREDHVEQECRGHAREDP